jgi:hypothetical protein
MRVNGVTVRMGAETNLCDYVTNPTAIQIGWEFLSSGAALVPVNRALSL